MTCQVMSSCGIAWQGVAGHDAEHGMIRHLAIDDPFDGFDDFADGGKGSKSQGTAF